MRKNIIIKGAREGNLQNIDVEIPREKLVVLTGLSGSGKTTLAMDLLFQECQRRYLEALGMSGIKKPDVDSVMNIAPAILILQTASNKNPRSTVGTVTGIYTDLRQIYEKLHVRVCPHCTQSVSAAECREEVEKIDGEFSVYMICNLCGHRMQKLIGGWFSFNTREGACPTCQGLGKTLAINPKTVMDESLSLENGAVDGWKDLNGKYMTDSFYAALRHYKMPVAPDTPVCAYSDAQKAVLLYGVESDEAKPFLKNTAPPKTVAGGKFEGVYTALLRRISEKGGEAKHLDQYFTHSECPTCHGERLAEISRSVTVDGKRLPELSLLPLDELLAWAEGLERCATEREKAVAGSYLTDLQTKIRRAVRMGLDYLTLDRQAITLSGGESQRLKLAAALDSSLSGIIYVMDEPTAGLHAKDTHNLMTALKQLRDDDNTVIVIEHDVDVMREADHIIDIGPGSGKHGGKIIGQGSLDELMKQADSVTGQYLKREAPHPQKRNRADNGVLSLHNARLHNLQNIDVDFPVGRLIAVTGVSGSGKSSLVFDVLGAETSQSGCGTITGLEQFDSIVRIEQTSLTRMKRSNVATYTDIWSEVRKVFAGLDDAKAKGLTAKHFSFNTAGGRCENCGGLGVVESHMLFFPNADVTCPVCGGMRFNEDVLSVAYKGYSINGILKASVEELPGIFGDNKAIKRMTDLLLDVGLGYLELGQTLTTLSGGEGQRLKLVKELLGAKGKRNLYLMDEPTSGLHPIDTEKFLALIERMVDAGNTVIVVEHNLQLVMEADWVIDLGPEGGTHGGKLIFAGTPDDLMTYGQTYTAEALRRFSVGASRC